MIEVITEGMRPNAVVLRAHGKVDHSDYARLVDPVIDAKVKAEGKVRILYHLGADFVGFSTGAIWDDTKLGLRHYSELEMVAIVTDVAWVRDSMAFLRFLIPCPTRLFRNEDLAQAMAWINEE